MPRPDAYAVVGAIGHPAPSNLILVAQSMGGFTAALVCERVAVRSLVFLNAMIPQSGETPGAWFANTQQAEARRRLSVRDGRDPDAPFSPLVDLFHDVPQTVINEAWARGEPRQSDRVFGSTCNFPGWPKVPIHVLVACDDRLFPASFQENVAKVRLGANVRFLPGGHLAALSYPDELVHHLLSIASAG